MKWFVSSPIAKIAAMVLATLFAATVWGSDREDNTVRMIARTLDRLGESKIAKRLIADHFERQRIHFGNVGRKGEMAETWSPLSGPNQMRLSHQYLAIADNPRRNVERPWSGSSMAVSGALTVLHEYVHMAQTNPDNVPKYEDPAYKASDAALARWAAQLESDWKRLRALPAGPTRDRELRDLLDLSSAVLSEAGLFKSAIVENQTRRKINFGLKLKVEQTVLNLRKLVSEMRKSSAGATKPVVPSTPSFGWVRVERKLFDQKPVDSNYVLDASFGTISWMWTLNNDAFGFTATWTEPPEFVPSGELIKMRIGCHITKNVGADYSANGAFTVWVDDPAVEPGSVIRPFQLTSADGSSPHFAMSHKPAVTSQPNAKEFWVDPKTLPSGKAGARFAIVVDAYIGRTAGARYVYEWGPRPKAP
jgi:hypothetical protein